MAIALVLLWGLLVSQCGHAEEAKSPGPQWVIVVTIIDLTTGERLKERTPLAGPTRACPRCG
jgi:hypothetical protein